MDAIVLSFRGEPLRVFPVNGRPLEVGSGPSCDIVVHDPAVPPRAWLIRQTAAGELIAHQLGGGEREVSLRSHQELPLSERYALSSTPELTPRAS